MIECTNDQLLTLAIGALGLGMYLLLKGGNWTIDAAVFVAKRLGVSPLIIGFTIVAFGTSLPELFVSVDANLEGSPGIAIGNVIGSNIANILFVLGITALFATLTVVPRAVLRDIVMMMLATLLLMGLMLHGGVDRFAGFAMIVTLILYVFWQYTIARAEKHVDDDMEDPQFSSLLPATAYLLGGLVMVTLGSEFLVSGAKVTATIIGVPEDVIGLSVIALGTSLPELTTCIIAAKKRHGDIVIGNIVGSNVFNILMIIGITAAVKPLSQESISQQIVSLDIWVMFATALALTLFLLLFKKITRPIGYAFCALYVLYIGVMYGLHLSKGVL